MQGKVTPQEEIGGGTNVVNHIYKQDGIMWY